LSIIVLLIALNATVQIAQFVRQDISNIQTVKEKLDVSLVQWDIMEILLIILVKNVNILV
jgi:hypothetical protein